MVATLNSIDREVHGDLDRGIVVEIVGIAGVGKTTLYQYLNSKNYPWLNCDSTPPVWKISTALFYTRNIIPLIPVLFQLFIKYNKFIKRRELAYLAIINGWHKLLQKKIHQSNQVLLLDQGPIFIIAYLKILGSQELFDACMNAWWEKIYNWWKQTIDLVIWLDATDEILYSRINNRLQEHLLKGQSKEACLLWLAKYQSVYREIINRISDSNPNLHIVHIDSGRCSVDNIADQIQIEFYKTAHNNNR